MAEEKKLPPRRPTALKRDIQNKKKQLRNRALKSRAKTANTSFEAALNKKDDPKDLKENLSTIFSLLDKGVKKGIYHKNKAARTKARLYKKIAL